MNIKRSAAQFLALMLVATILTGFVYPGQEDYENTTYEMYVNYKKVGNVKFPSDGLAVYDKVVERVKQRYWCSVFVEGKTLFRETNSRWTSSQYELAEAIEDAVKVKPVASAIIVDGKTVCYLPTKQEAQRVLESIKERIVRGMEGKDGISPIEMYFKEDIAIEEKPVAWTSVINFDKAKELFLLKGHQDNEAGEGDSAYGPQIEVTVVTKEKMECIEEIPFKIKIKENDEMYRGQRSVLEKGKTGKKRVGYYIIRENGREATREKIWELVVSKPVGQIEERGTKSYPIIISRATGTASEIISFAMKYLGKPYVYGGNGPDVFDCTGFTCFVFKHFGVELPRSAKDQGYSNYAPKVTIEELQPGDLVFFNTIRDGDVCDHAGIYIGDRRFIHASSSRKSGRYVKIGSLDSNYYRRVFAWGRRVLRD